jgi:hypothetical protein
MKISNEWTESVGFDSTYTKAIKLLRNLLRSDSTTLDCCASARNDTTVSFRITDRPLAGTNLGIAITNVARTRAELKDAVIKSSKNIRLATPGLTAGGLTLAESGCFC